MSAALTAAKKRRILDLVADGDEGLADDLAAALDVEDPTAQAIEALAKELRAMRWMYLIVTVVAMALNAGMVGVGLSVGLGQQRLEVTQATPSAIMLEDVTPEPPPAPLAHPGPLDGA